MSVIEAELVKLFKFKKSPEDFFDRQDYLDAICQAVEKIKEDKVFDDMTEPTYDWLQEAVEAHNKKREIPDFPDAELEEAESASEAEETEVAEADPEVNEEAVEKELEEAEAADADPEVDEEAVEKELEEAEAADAEEAEAAAELDAELPAGEAEPAEPPDVEGGTEPAADEAPAKKPRKKPVKAGKYIKKKRGKPDVEPKHKPGHEPDYRKVTGKKNRYGVTAGTKADLALKMFEKGCTMRDANIELGDNYYVLLRRLVGQGHRLEKLENRVLKLIHKDDLPKKKGK